MMIAIKTKNCEAGTGFASLFLATTMALCAWGQTVQTHAECPSIEFNNGDIGNTSRILTPGEDVSCCLHHLQVLVVYENLDPWDEFYVHGVRIVDDTQHTLSGNKLI